jgi:hypothetical protein
VAPPSAPRNQAAESGLRRIDVELAATQPNLAALVDIVAWKAARPWLMSCQLGWAAHSEAPDAASNGAGATTRTTTVTRCTEEPLKDRRGRADIYGRNKTTALHPAISAGVLPLSWGWLWLRGAGGRSHGEAR